MIGWIDENGNPQGGFPDKIIPVREQLKKNRGCKPENIIENPQPYLENDGPIPEPEVKTMSNIGKDLKLNRAERRKLAKDAKKETGKKENELTIDDVLKTISANRKKNSRRK